MGKDTLSELTHIHHDQTITHKRLETAISSALAADVTAMLDVECELKVMRERSRCLQDYKQNGDSSARAHENSSCSRRGKTCTSLGSRKRVGVCREVRLDRAVSRNMERVVIKELTW